MKVLVAGVGNVLRGDDGFGVAVIEKLATEPTPEGVRILDIGIGGIHLVQELLVDPVDLVIVIDAVDMGRPPGTVLVIAPTIEEVASLSLEQRHDKLADMHYSTPDRALMLANAMGALPAEVWVVGCQPAAFDELGEGLSEQVQAAVEVAMAEVRTIVRDRGLSW